MWLKYISRRLLSQVPVPFIIFRNFLSRTAPQMLQHFRHDLAPILIGSGIRRKEEINDYGSVHRRRKTWPPLGPFKFAEDFNTLGPRDPNSRLDYPCNPIWRSTRDQLSWPTVSFHMCISAVWLAGSSFQFRLSLTWKGDWTSIASQRCEAFLRGTPDRGQFMSRPASFGATGLMPDN